jgi:hypothetical protein
MLSRRGVLLGGLSAAVGVAFAGKAGATVARALTLNELVHQSRHGFVGTPVDQFGRWETVGRRSRIVTYTLVRVEAAVDGRLTPTSDVMVRTLGGAVGDIGQAVPGEALFVKGESGTMFVDEISRDLFVVTGMSQGLYPLRADAQGIRRLKAATGQLSLWGNQADAAVQRLDGRTVLEVESMVYEELSRGPR